MAAVQIRYGIYHFLTFSVKHFVLSDPLSELLECYAHIWWSPPLSLFRALCCIIWFLTYTQRPVRHGLKAWLPSLCLAPCFASPPSSLWLFVRWVISVLAVSLGHAPVSFSHTWKMVARHILYSNKYFAKMIFLLCCHHTVQYAFLQLLMLWLWSRLHLIHWKYHSCFLTDSSIISTLSKLICGPYLSNQFRNQPEFECGNHMTMLMCVLLICLHGSNFIIRRSRCW